eukprot:UN33845
MLSRCWFCYTSKRIKKHLTIALGLNTYLALRPHVPISKGNCVIVPLDHNTALRKVDGQIYEEIRYFMKCLVKMFAAQGRSCIFMESALGDKHHAFMECIPIKNELFKDADVYFRKAIMEGDVMWNTNKRLIETKEKGLMRSVPTHMPYFHVEFGMDGGFLHVIEDAEKFGQIFGKLVVCGMLGLDGDLP